ncbi:MAG: M48 family metallopeptidase [Alistipes senegalensis]|nr:M48 family metallopeptidase [Oxalobacter formigenes]MCM1281545.1 M48 family metallopeptidase [Alistipes senegalensis]
MEKFHLQELTISIRRKPIKSLRLAVCPPAGDVRISAPPWMSEERIRLFALSRLNWIRKQRRLMQAQERETPREYLNRETHFVWGYPCLLHIEEQPAAPRVTLDHTALILQVRPHATAESMDRLLQGWYRRILREAALPRLAAWQDRLNLPPVTLRIRRMKTRWGSCTPAHGSILLNTELAKKPRECLEYIILHELTHFLEPNHGVRFTAILDKHLPHWRTMKKRLNRLPLRAETWEN